MARLIEADTAKQHIRDYGKGAISDGLKTLDPVDDIIMIAGIIDMMPTVDAETVRHGRWLTPEGGYGPTICSECHECSHQEHAYTVRCFAYCPKCGAKMEDSNK